MKDFFDRLRGCTKPVTLKGTSAGRLMDVAITCFNDNNWKFRKSDRAGVLQFCIGGKNANFEGAIVNEEDNEEIHVFVQAPNKAPESRRLAVADFLARANYGMKFGALEMDYSDGEVRFKMSAILRKGQLSPQMVHAMIGISFTTIDHLYPALMGVCFGNQLPSEAVKTIRSQQAQDG